MWHRQIGPGDHVFWGSDVGQGMHSKVGVCHLLIWTGSSVQPYLGIYVLQSWRWLLPSDLARHTWHHSRTQIMIISSFSLMFDRFDVSERNTLPSSQGFEGLASWLLEIQWPRNAMQVTGNVRATLFFSADVKEHKIRCVQSATTSLACSQHQARYGLGWGPKVPSGLSFFTLINFIIDVFIYFSI